MRRVTKLVFLDANVPMYIVGADHPNKWRAESALRRLGRNGERLVTDAEVFQEILHRFGALGRWSAIQDAFDLLNSWCDEVFPVDYSLVESAKSTLLTYRELSARDALHVAAMLRHGVSEILSFDQGYDLVASITRISS